MRTLGYESSFASFLPLKTDRSFNSPDSRAKAYSDMAAFGLENFFKSAHSLETKEREALVDEVLRFKASPSSALAAGLVEKLRLQLNNCGTLTDGQEVQVRKALIALIDYAKLNRSDVLSGALLELGRFFDQ